jgi:AcrR family transcriptional regulator
VPTVAVATIRELAARYSPAQRRTLDVALQLFAHHSVGGTSLQMIAEELGVTKAAVYHQFRTKESILEGVLEVHLVPLEAALEVAVAAGGTRTAREQLLESVIETVVRDRTVATLQSDPVLARLLGEHEPTRHLFSRLFALLLGDGSGSPDRARAAVVSAAIGAAAHPYLSDLDDDTVRRDLLAIVRSLVFGPD